MRRGFPPVTHRVAIEHLDPLPALTFGALQVRAAEPAVAARIRWAPEADLVPCPRVRVEARQGHAHDQAERVLDVQLSPGATLQPAVSQPLDNVLLNLRGGDGK